MSGFHILTRAAVGAITVIGLLTNAGVAATPTVKRTIKADVVALDQCFMCNRLGTAMPQGMVFALRRDVVSTDANDPTLRPGKVTLRPGKRPRPIVLRMNVGDCLDITFQNLLSPLLPPTPTGLPETVKTREAGIHVLGMQLVESIADDGSWVGANASSLSSPGDAPRHYKVFAERQGAFLLYSTAADVGARGGNADAGQLTAGLFGAVTVQPEGAEWYRSQVTRADLQAAVKIVDGKPVTTPDGHPVIDYDATHGDKTPVLKMLDADNEIISSDLTAIITGPNHGPFPVGDPSPSFVPNPVLPPLPPPPANNGRLEPYREIVIHYHDALTALQAFPQFFSTDPLAGTLNQGRDQFAINYGIAGIGPEILANRIGVGPMRNSVESKFEEFFLSSWVVGDPAMVVDRPANSATAPAPDAAACGPDCPKHVPSASPTPGPKATKAFFPDDPSNVYHSYLHDHVKFRILHAGNNITHIHHQHAHQWLRSPNSDDSTLLDSQMITPGDGYTLEMIYGSGNRNMTPGDSIFHCHFYPHFAEGMWSLWRVHDVFEEGTELDDQGRPTATARALPDGEIPTGTPIPALVPIPTLPMAPVPAKVKLVAATGPAGAGSVGQRAELVDPVADKDKNPGYPFFIPGVAGRRAPHPPYDFAVEQTDKGPQTLDGGLPRHLVLGPDQPIGLNSDGDVLYQRTNQWDFSKDNLKLVAMQLPEDGTPVEKAAIAFSQKGKHDTFYPNGNPAPGGFRTNGLGPLPGAPFADPGIDDQGHRITDVRRYKAADIQLDVVFNKKGWHFPQQRIISLWEDVKPTLAGTRAPEPLFVRANSGEVVEFWQANLVPDYYELDDFQVRTPTDIIGQHIHLVKFDVLASDGAANGFNYEDGTFSPGTVRERIAAIQAVGGLWSYDPSWQFKTTTQAPLSPKPIPDLGPGPDGKEWLGAQATVQRWWADPLVNRAGQDRTLQTVFTHDHFGPSTHQQAGLYAGLLVEPPGDTKWTDPVTGHPMPSPERNDGGPTSWQAVITYTNPATKQLESFREFALEFQDLQLAYQLPQPPAQPVTSPKPYPRGYTALPADPWGWSDTPNAINATRGGFSPSLISPGPEQGTRSVNYRNEPVPLRIAGADPTSPEGDLSHAYLSIPRKDGQLNVQPRGPIPGTDAKFFYPGPFPGAGNHDPYTPLMRAYENDRVKVRVLVGAHLLPHAFSIHGVNWLTEPSYAESGYRSTQPLGLSEHFEMQFTVPTTTTTATGSTSADYLYMASASFHGQVNGLWGILRSYKGPIAGLQPLPTNTEGRSPAGTDEKIRRFLANQPTRSYQVSAITAAQALGGSLVYNSTQNAGGGPIQDPNALLYVLSDDLDGNNHLISGIVEPLILRAKAGEVIRVTVTNRLDPKQGAFATQAAPFSLLKPSPLSSIPGATSTFVGLHPQLVSFDVTQSNAFNVGNNPDQTVAPPKSNGNGTPEYSSKTYEWYAGNLVIGSDGEVEGVPVEFGAINLLPSDPLLQTPTGLYAALIVEPGDTESWTLDPGTRAAATITTKDGRRFREFAVLVQEASNAGAASVNYRSEPWVLRLPEVQQTGGDFNQLSDVDQALSNVLTSYADPQTPVFVAPAGSPARFRMLHPNPLNNSDFNVPNFLIHGHVWARQPFAGRSTRLGDNPLSEWTGSSGSFLPNDQFNILLERAGGLNAVPGDYLYRDYTGSFTAAGMWGIFRVVDPKTDVILIRNATYADGTLTLEGIVRSPFEGGEKRPASVSLVITTKNKEVERVADAKVSPQNQQDGTWGTWTLVAENLSELPDSVRVETSNGGILLATGRRPRVIAQLVGIAAAPVTPEEARRAGTAAARLDEDTLRFSPQVVIPQGVQELHRRLNPGEQGGPNPR